jgi:amino acid transporter
MVPRALYGLSARGQLPRWLDRVDRHTRTPLVATLLASACMLVLVLIGLAGGVLCAGFVVRAGSLWLAG